MRAQTVIKSGIAIVAVAALVSCSGTSKKQTENAAQPDYQLVWADEFDYEGLPDSTKWSYDTEGNAWSWGNNEAQFYTEKRLENVEVKDGILRITAIREPVSGKEYSSCRLRTKGKGDWLYGKFEFSAKLPAGRGLWPALWMMPSNSEYGPWPASGEIDIMENVGYMPDTILSTVHTRSYNHMIHTQRPDSICIPDCYDNFHVYRLEWEPGEMRTYVDDAHFYTFKNEGTGPNEWPFDKPFHIIMNIAVGGGWGGLHGIDETIFPRSMYVDYVRVYQKVAEN